MNTRVGGDEEEKEPSSTTGIYIDRFGKLHGHFLKNEE